MKIEDRSKQASVYSTYEMRGTTSVHDTTGLFSFFL